MYTYANIQTHVKNICIVITNLFFLENIKENTNNVISIHLSLLLFVILKRAKLD